MNFNDVIGKTSFSDGVVSNLQRVIARANQIHQRTDIRQQLSLIARSSQILDRLHFDLRPLLSHKDYIKEASLINIIFHCPFVNDVLPGTFYMPKLKQSAVNRAAFIATSSHLHSTLNNSLNPVTLLITTPEWYFSCISTFAGSGDRIIPVFISEEIKFPMFLRHAAYVFLLGKLRSLFSLGPNVILSFHDSDLLPIFSWESVHSSMVEQLFDLFFTYRFSSNLLPLNGGLFFARPTDKAEQLMNYSLGLYDLLSQDILINKIYPSSIKVWDGDQIILNSIGEWDDENPFEHFSILNCSKMGILPACNLNFSVKELKADTIASCLDKNVKAIHLKGTAKELITVKTLSTLSREILLTCSVDDDL